MRSRLNNSSKNYKRNSTLIVAKIPIFMLPDTLKLKLGKKLNLFSTFWETMIRNFLRIYRKEIFQEFGATFLEKF